MPDYDFYWLPPDAPDDRPVIGKDGQVITPAADTTFTAAWLDLLIAFIGGKRPPGCVKQPEVTEKMRLHAAVHRRAANDANRAAGNRTSPPVVPAPRPEIPAVVGTAQQPSSSDVDYITTAQAADLARCYTAEWWRRLAVAEKIPAYQDHRRRVWMLSRAGVLAYRRGRTGGTGGCEDTGSARDARRPDGGRAEGRGRAA